MAHTETEDAKLTVRIRPDQRRELQQLLPWGIQRPLFELIIDDLLAILRQPKICGLFLATVLDGRIRPGEILPVLRLLEEGKKQ